MSALDITIDTLVSTAKRNLPHIPTDGLRSLKWFALRAVAAKLAAWRPLYSYIRALPGNEHMPFIAASIPEELRELIEQCMDGYPDKYFVPNILRTRWISRIEPKPQGVSERWVIKCLTDPEYKMSLDEADDENLETETCALNLAIPIRLLDKEVLSDLKYDTVTIVDDILRMRSLVVMARDDGEEIERFGVRIGEHIYFITYPDGLTINSVDIWGCYSLGPLRTIHPHIADIVYESAKAFPDKFVADWDPYVGDVKEHYEMAHGAGVIKYTVEAEYWDLPPALEH
jgi:hypothetical protein